MLDAELELTLEMLAAAEAADWDLVEALRERRDASLHRFFEEPVSEAAAPEVEEALRALIERNDALKALVCDARAKTREAAAEVPRSRRVQLAYASSAPRNGAR